MTNIAAPFALAKLRKHVTAAAAEFDLAVTFYETWRTATDDTELHERLGKSYATNTYRVIVTALRRELLLALNRMWDNSSSALRLHILMDSFRDPNTIAMLATARGVKIEEDMMRSAGAASRASVTAIIESVKDTLGEKASAALVIVDKYAQGGPGYPLRQKLKAVRDERLAHHEVEAIVTPHKNATDAEIEEFYRDNADLISLLLRLVNATAYHPDQGAEIHRTYARNFWASVEGERTEGHPFFRPPPKDTI